jgi:ribA/ribD-fused uncharacterized protein
MNLQNFTRLRELASTARVEWHVADPVTKAYCTSFDRSTSLDPEGDAHAWLEDHRKRFPDSRHAKFEVMRVEVRTELQQLAGELVDAFAALPVAAQPQGMPPEWLSDQYSGEFDDMTAGQGYRKGWNDCRTTMLTGQASAADQPTMVYVNKEDANRYCDILRLLGMEEEGDPVAEVQRLQGLTAPNLENLQDRLLSPTTIDRDSLGHWYHPHLPDTDEGVSYGDLLAVFGMEVACIDMEGDAPEDVAERYFEQGGPDCSDWQPTPPEGEGWALLAIFDTEDGPHALFARKARPEQYARHHLSPRRWAQRLVKFLNAAAGEGLVLDGIDAADLFTEVLPKTYMAALREADDAATVKPLQPHGFIKPDTLRAVYFYEQDFYVLSNFSAFTLMWHGLRFDTSEAAYHYEKFKQGDGCASVRAAIMNAPSAHLAFKIAERNKALRRPDWDQVKVQIMRSILRAKVDQHEYVRRKLLATGDRELVEDSWRDDFWGWGPNRDGKNMLGKLWMEIRAELRTQPQEGGA